MIASLVALVVLSAVPQEPALGGDPLSQKLTFSGGAARLEMLLPELSKVAGIRLEASPSTKNQVLLLRVRDMPLKALMAKVADVCSAEWELDKDVYRLGRSEDLTRKQEAADAAARLEELRGFSERLKKELGADKPWGQEDADRFVQEYRKAWSGQATDRDGNAKRTALEIARPTGRFGDRLFTCLDLRVLAGLRYGERIVFANDPTPVQRALPVGALTALRNYQARRACLARAVAKYGSAPEDAGQGALTWLYQLNGPPVARMVVSAARDRAILVEVRLLDESGTLVESGACAFIAEGQDKTPQPAGLDKVAVEYSEDTARLLASIRAALPQTPEPAWAKAQLPKDLMDRFLDPLHFDPLSTQPADDVASLAAAMKATDVVALLPDELYGLRRAAARKTTASDVWEMLVKDCKMEVATKDGCLMVRHRWPSSEARRRTDRQAIHNLYGTYRSGGYVDLDAMATFATHCSTLQWPSLSPFVMEYPDPQLRAEAFYASPQQEWLRFYGLLTASEKLALGSGRPLTVGSLNPAAKSELVRSVYWSRGPFQLRSGEGPFGRLPETLHDEPTEVFPDGIPSSATLSAKTQVDEGYFPVGQAVYVVWSPMTLAQVLFRKETGTGTDKVPERFRAGKTARMNVTAELSPGVGLSWGYMDRWIDPIQGPVPFSALSEGFRSEVQRCLDLLRQLPRPGGG